MEVLIYLLDTDTLIFLIRGLKSNRSLARHDRAQRILDECRKVQARGDTIGVSAVTVSELEFGARNADDYEAEMAWVRMTLAPFMIFDYDAVTCPPAYGMARCDLESKGVPIGSMDLLIAAHALALDATLVSNNLAHFGRVKGLRTVNWVLDRGM